MKILYRECRETGYGFDEISFNNYLKKNIINQKYLILQNHFQLDSSA